MLITRLTGRGIFSNGDATKLGNGIHAIRGGGQISGGMQFGSQGNGADTTEDVLFTFTLSANSLDLVGRGLLIEAYGTIAATSATKTVKLYFGTQSVPVAQATTTQTGSWQAMMSVWKVGSSQQHIEGQSDFAGGSTPRGVTLTTTATENDQAAIVIKVTGQSSIATANLVVCNGLVISGYN